jgi:hypothetical protein
MEVAPVPAEPLAGGVFGFAAEPAAPEFPGNTPPELGGVTTGVPLLSSIGGSGCGPPRQPAKDNKARLAQTKPNGRIRAPLCANLCQK